MCISHLTTKNKKKSTIIKTLGKSNKNGKANTVQFNSLPHKPKFKQTHKKEAFENILEKGENAGDQHCSKGLKHCDKIQKK